MNVSKNQFRKKIISILKQSDLTSLSLKACQILSQRFANFNYKIAAYWPLKTEISLISFMENYSQNGGTILLPSILDDSKILNFCKWTPQENLIKNPLNTMEPKQKNFDVPDVIIAPLVACDFKNFRLGRGGGYYDATIAFYKTSYPFVKFIGTAASFQVFEHIPLEQHDQKLDEILII